MSILYEAAYRHNCKFTLVRTHRVRAPRMLEKVCGSKGQCCPSKGQQVSHIGHSEESIVHTGHEAGKQGDLHWLLKPRVDVTRSPKQGPQWPQ